jgi:hypothetical protein
MDHEYINEFDLVDRYLMGKLAGEEITQFEEHFVDCAECTDRLTTTKALIEGLRIVAIDRVPEERTPVPQGSLSSLRQTISRRAFAVAASVLLLVVLGGVALLFIQVRRFRFEAEQARSAATQLERRYEEQRESSDIVDREHKESERELTDQVAQLRTELEHAREQEPARGTEVNVPILALSSTRGNEGSSGARKEISLPPSHGSVFLSVLLEGEGEFRTYRMTIVNSQSQVIWKGVGLKANAYNSLSARLNSALFLPGDYLLTLDGVARDGSTSVVGKYSFRVRKAP